MKPLLTLIAATATLFAQSTANHPSGHITGILIDENGSPVSSATVYAVSQGAVLDNVTAPSVKTDGNGRFDFDVENEFGYYNL